MIDPRRAQRSFGDRLIAEEVDGLDEQWMVHADEVLADEKIVMAAYAPLLVNVNPGGMQWETDLIGYNTIKSYGSPAYYAQVMFASYLGDHTVASKLENADPKLFYSSTLNTAKKQLYLKLVNASSDPQPVQVALRGAQPTSSAKLIRLSAPDTQTTNIIYDPNRLVPVESSVHDLSANFPLTLPAYSIQVLQIDLQ